MQQSCTYGSVRGAPGNRRSYRDKTVHDKHSDAHTRESSSQDAFTGVCRGAPVAGMGPTGARVETRRLHQTALGSSFGNRIRLKAALAKTNSQSTLGSPRSLTLRIQAMVFSHPNAGSMRGRAC